MKKYMPRNLKTQVKRPNFQKSIISQNLWETALAVLRGKFIAIQAYPKKNRNISNNPTLQLQALKKQQQSPPKASRRKEINKIRAELNNIETNSTIPRINISRRWFFEKINKIDKPLSRLIKKKRGDQGRWRQHTWERSPLPLNAREIPS